jgi:hypothetical protein
MVFIAGVCRKLANGNLMVLNANSVNMVKANYNMSGNTSPAQHASLKWSLT